MIVCAICDRLVDRPPGIPTIYRETGTIFKCANLCNACHELHKHDWIESLEVGNA